MININKLEFKTFPGGELHITDSWTNNGQILQDQTVLCRIRESSDLMKLCLFTDAFKRFTGRMPYRLILPYIPYARQDRVANPGEALSIKVFSQIINSLNYRQVIVLDPHSDVSVALIDNIKVIPQWDIFSDSIMEGVDLISPDAGALKKIYNLQKAVKEKGIDVPVRTATKHRDTQTGYISNTTLDGNAQNNTCIVVDDICDGGGTFLALGKTIKQQYEKCILMVTHGIFSRGLEDLSNIYDRILATNSFNGDLKAEGALRVINVEKFLK